MSEKVTGYSLLTIGVLVMVFSLVQVTMLFTGRIRPLQLFNSQAQVERTITPQEGVSNELMPLLEQALAQQNSFLSPESINRSLNLSAHVFLMFFVLSFGYKVASLGVQLVRPIKVNLKETFLK